MAVRKPLQFSAHYLDAFLEEHEVEPDGVSWSGYQSWRRRYNPSPPKPVKAKLDASMFDMLRFHTESDSIVRQVRQWQKHWRVMLKNRKGFNTNT